MFQRSVGVVAACGLFIYLLTLAASPGHVADSCGPYDPQTTLRLCGSDEQTASAVGLTVADVRAIRRSQGVTNAALLQMTPQMVAKSLRKVDMPKAAPGGIAFRNLSYLDANGEVAPGALMDAHAQCQGLPPGGALAPIGPGGGLAPVAWTEMGPGNIGGRIRAIAIDPADNDHIFIGSASGGIWETTDGGASWTPLDDFMANLAVTSIIIDPNNTSTMYASTGEGFTSTTFSTSASRLQLGRGAGVFQSLDGGTTWNQLAATNTVDFQWTDRLSIAADSSAILAATLTGIFRSDDGGLSWPQVSTIPCGDVDFDPTDGTGMRAVAGSINNQNFLWSNDGGASWNTTPIPAGATPDSRRVETTWATGVAGSVYASVYSNSANGMGSRSVLYRSTDNGQSFNIQNQTLGFLASQGWYDNIVWAAPTDVTGAASDQTVIVGGVWLFRSTDGGVNFTQISAGTPPHADNHFIVGQNGFDGSAAATSQAWFGTDGGITRADDVFDVGTVAGRADTTPATNVGWTNLNNNLRITQFYGGDAVADDDGTMLGGTQDNGTILGTGTGGVNAWTIIRGADGSYAQIDRANPMNMFGAIQSIGIFRSTDGGGSFTDFTAQIPEAGSGNGANFIGATYIDPNDATRWLAGGPRLWLSTNALAAVPTFASIKAASASNISTFTIAEGNSDIIWVGHNDGEVWWTSNGTAAVPTWTRRDNQMPNLPDRFVSRIVIDPANDSRVFVCFGGFFSDNIWETTDDGATWRMLEGLPAMPYRDCQIHPNNPTWLYAASELGVLSSENNGYTWSMPNDGPANVAVDDLMWVDTTLYAATHGRGWWRQETVDPADMVAPTITCNIQRSVLWPPSHGLFPIGLTASAVDVMDPSPMVTVNVYTDEPEGVAPFAPDAIGTTPMSTRLRSERLYPGNGRVFLVVVTAVDDASNVAHACHSTVVPAVPNGMGILMVRAEAMAAEAACAANDGQPPAGYDFLLSYTLP